jgi:hypothetical protein
MITIVSGLPRSGTSLMMQMLAAAGLPILTDGIRQPDQDNPKGYFEWEKVAHLCSRPEIMNEAEGKAVKVISRLLHCLPQGHEYKVIFMRRAFAQVVMSQQLMLMHRHGKIDSLHESMEMNLEKHIWNVIEWSAKHPELNFWFVNYRELVTTPDLEVRCLRLFLGLPINKQESMAACVDPSLYHQRVK